MSSTFYLFIFILMINSSHKPLLAKNSGGADFQMIDAGNYIARCISVIDMGTTLNTRFNIEYRKVRITWETPNETAVFKEEKGEQPYAISKEYTLSLSEKSNLRKHLESWRGKPFTSEELEWFDLHNILWVPCMLQIIHNPSKTDPTKIYAEVSSVGSMPKGMICPEQINESVWFNLEEFDEKTYGSFSDYLKNRIAESNEYKSLAEAKDIFE